MQQIYLVRHGRTEWNEAHRLQGRLPGVGLSSFGLKQARQTAEILRGVEIDRILVSPLERAVQTASIINEYHDVPLASDEYWNEWDMQKWQGLLFSEIEAKFPDQFRLWRDNPAAPIDFNGELLAEVAHRMYEGLERAVASYPGQAILIVSHSDPLKALTAAVLGMPLENIGRFQLDNAALTQLAFDKGRFQLITLNSAGLAGR